MRDLASNLNDRRVYWLTVREAADFLGVSEPTLRKWTDGGMVGAFRTPGGHRRFRLEDLIRFRDGREEPRPASGEI